MMVLTLHTFNASTASRGQEVTKAVYERFLNALPPISLNGGPGWYTGFQLQEAYCDVEDSRIGQFRPIYATFTSRDGHYYYQGFNFSGEVDSRPYMGEVPSYEGSATV